MLLAISSRDLELAGIYVVTLVLSIAVHEYFHALAASRLGDPTPESEGRLTLNPIAHADPIGTLALPIIAALSSLPAFGWGKPVQTQPRHYTRKVSMRTGMGIVAVAGPLGNLVLATFVLLVGALANLAGVLSPSIEMPLILLLQINVILMVFNLLPLHPLDGGKILAALLPPKYEWVDEWIGRYGPMILVAMIVFGRGILGEVFGPFLELSNAAWEFVLEVSA
jgi:Zn-dependent protease